MRIAHLADVHLGFRAYRATDDFGRNLREVDVERAFFQAVDDILAASPDVVLIAGDLFHVSRPYPWVIRSAVDGIEKLARHAPVLIAGGNHEHPSAHQNGNPVDIVGRIDGVFAATSHTEGYAIPGTDAWALVVPEPDIDVDAIRDVLDAEPDESGATKILLMHGAVNARNERLYHHGALPVDVLDPDRWDYVALGDYHVYTELAPTAYYAGSLEYTSTDIWMEARTGVGKGWVLYDTETGEAHFNRVDTRRVVDLDPFDGDGMTGTEITMTALDFLQADVGDVEGAIIRQVVHNVPRTVASDLDWSEIEAVRSLAVHYHLDLRRPEPVASPDGDTPDGDTPSPRRVMSLDDEARAFAETWEPTPGVERDDVLASALSYLNANER